MRKMNKVLAVVLAVLTATFTLSAEEVVVKIAGDKATVDVTDMTFSADGSVLNAKYSIEVAPELVPDCASILLTPVVKGGNQTYVPEIILINGKNVCERHPWLACKLAEVVKPEQVRCFHMEGETLKIESSYAIPAESWMDGGEFDVATQKVTYETNCIKNFPGSEYVCPVPFETVLNPVLAKINIKRPTAPAKKHSLKTRIYYPVNGTAEVSSYFENAEALELLDALDEDNFEVESIVINGWASPEASVAYNTALSLKRAVTVRNIISRKFKFDETVFAVKGDGEYWDLVIDFINNSDAAVIAANRAALQKAVADNDNLDKREAAIKAVAGGKAYREIFNSTYPRSRFADCVVTYKVKEFTIEGAKALYNADPSAVSANGYATWLSQEYNAAVAAKALEIYPADEGVNAVVATHEYEAGNYEAAIAHYKKAGSSNEVLNNIGCCYNALGDVASAKEYLKQAGTLAQ